MTIETYKVEAITGPRYGESIDLKLGVAVSFNIITEFANFDVTTKIMGYYDRSFSEWNKYFHDILVIK